MLAPAMAFQAAMATPVTRRVTRSTRSGRDHMPSRTRRAQLLVPVGQPGGAYPGRVEVLLWQEQYALDAEVISATCRWALPAKRL